MNLEHLKLPLVWLKQSLKGVGEMWSEPADARALAIYRVLVFYYIANDFPGDLPEELHNAAEFTWRPRSFYALLNLSVPSVETGHFLLSVTTVCAMLAALGCAYRVTAPIAAVLAAYWFGMMMNMGKALHTYYVFSIVAVALSFSRASDAWSLDALVRRAIARYRDVTYAPPAPNAAYRWPLLFAGSSVLIMYGAAGLTKLDVSGLQWVFSDTLLNLMGRIDEESYRGTIVTWLREHPNLCKLLAGCGLTIEVGAWAGLLNRRLYWICGYLAMSLQYGIFVLMRVYFGALPTVYAAFVPWGLVLRAGDALFAKARHLVSQQAG